MVAANNTPNPMELWAEKFNEALADALNGLGIKHPDEKDSHWFILMSYPKDLGEDVWACANVTVTRGEITVQLGRMLAEIVREEGRMLFRISWEVTKEGVEQEAKYAATKDGTGQEANGQATKEVPDQDNN